MNAPVAVGYSIAPLLAVDKHKVQTYFQTLAMHDTLRYRFADIPNPTWSEVLDVIRRMGQGMFLVLNQYDEVQAEFTLENYTGRAAQSHFSTHPSISTNERIQIGKLSLEHIFSLRNPETDQPILDAVFGLTPLTNRAACIFALKIGYKKQGVLPSGMIVDGEPVNCMISVASRKEVQ